jgi:hypothetical protein
MRKSGSISGAGLFSGRRGWASAILAEFPTNYEERRLVLSGAPPVTVSGQLAAADKRRPIFFHFDFCRVLVLLKFIIEQC